MLSGWQVGVILEIIQAMRIKTKWVFGWVVFLALGESDAAVGGALAKLKSDWIFNAVTVSFLQIP